jgi:hypothetical protein
MDKEPVEHVETEGGVSNDTRKETLSSAEESSGGTSAGSSGSRTPEPPKTKAGFRRTFFGRVLTAVRVEVGVRLLDAMPAVLSYLRRKLTALINERFK